MEIGSHSPGDLEAAADLIYDELETEYPESRRLPSQREMIHRMILKLGFSYSHSLQTIAIMERKHRTHLESMGHKISPKDAYKHINTGINLDDLFEKLGLKW